MKRRKKRTDGFDRESRGIVRHWEVFDTCFLPNSECDNIDDRKSTVVADLRSFVQRAAIYNYECCMSSAPFGHINGIQLGKSIRLDIPTAHIYRALALRFS